MITVRRSEDRGFADHGWLQARHSFSFADYVDREHMLFKSLRVLNEDRIAPGSGFDTHPHKDMEIITYVLEGQLEHRDSMGNGSIIEAGDVQYMSAGSGVLHSEFNPSDRTTHLLQIWLFPRNKGLEPRYDQRHFGPEALGGRLKVIISHDGRDGSMTMDADAVLFASVLDAGAVVRHELEPGRHAWLQVARGSLQVHGVALEQGDGAAIGDEAVLEIAATSACEFLLFDLG